MLTERERVVWNELMDWEQQLSTQQSNRLNRKLDEWLDLSFSKLPEDVQEQFFHVIDNWLFHLHAMIQESQFQQNAKDKILSKGRVFEPNISEVSDMQQLTIDQMTYIASEQIFRHRLYSLAQGGFTGTGKALFIGADIPALAIINLRVIQLISTSYGYKMNTPFEIMTSLKCFHGAMLPKDWKIDAWQSLTADVENEENLYFHEEEDDLVTIQWLEQPLKQMLKLIVISMFKNKQMQGVPIISMAIGAGANYQLTKSITDFSHKYYQFRYLKEQQGG